MALLSFRRRHGQSSNERTKNSPRLKLRSLDNKLQALARLSPAHVRVVEHLVDLLLIRLMNKRRRWSLLMLTVPTVL